MFINLQSWVLLNSYCDKLTFISGYTILHRIMYLESLDNKVIFSFFDILNYVSSNPFGALFQQSSLVHFLQELLHIKVY